VSVFKSEIGLSFERDEISYSLYDQNGVITRQQTKILQLSKSYYENLCKSTHPNIEEVKT
jgi:hypothetical protein